MAAINQTSPRRDALIIGALVLVALVSRGVFLLRESMTDGDSLAMAAGLAFGLSPHVHFGDSIFYGRQVSPGTYLLFRLLQPVFHVPASGVMTFLNRLALISSGILVVPLYLLFRNSLTRSTAAAAILLVLASPVMWDLGTSYHPVLPAMALLAFAMVAWQAMFRPPPGPAPTNPVPAAAPFLFTLTWILASAAVVMRVEMFLALPAFLAGILARPDRTRRLPAFVTLTALVGGTYLLAVHLLPPATDGGSSTLAGYFHYFRGMVWPAFSPAIVPHTATWTAFGAGVGSIALAIAGGWRARSSRRGTDRPDRRISPAILTAILMIAVPTALWITYPVPIPRHFVLIVPALAWLAGRLAMEPLRIVSAPELPGGGRAAPDTPAPPPRRVGAAVLLAAAVLLNPLLPEAIYRTWNSLRPDAAKAPIGTFFYRLEQSKRQAAGYHEVISKIAGGPAFVDVDWNSWGYVAYALAAAGDVRIITRAEIGPGVFLNRYESGGREYQILFGVVKDDPAFAPILVSAAQRAAGEGCRVFVTREDVVRGWVGRAPEFAFESY